MRKRLLWQLFPSYFLIAAIAFFIAGQKSELTLFNINIYIILAIITAVSYFMAYKLSRPLVKIKETSDRFARGDLSHRLYISDSRETGLLADSFNTMAEQLSERINTIIAQDNEKEAILTSMHEGLIAVDLDQRIININLAAVNLIDEKIETVKGRKLQEIVRNTALKKFVELTLKSSESTEDQIEFYWREKLLVLKLHGTALKDAQHKRIGALVVLNDITKICHLENVRKDFVANVSHELKTPITSIVGFVETLQDGAIESKEDTSRFLEIISKQSNRLNSIIDDLLILSKIEQQNEKAQVEMKDARLIQVLESAITLCKSKQTDKLIEIQLNCDPELRIKMNASMIEQAVMNLVDNAVKYSGSNDVINVVVTTNSYEVKIDVIDQGCGIEKEHLARLFERFYRVDKARSRKQGGTGLGLAIVKHIAQSHKGRVRVESQFGSGSCFSIILPKNC